jgi:hypothetical protein
MSKFFSAFRSHMKQNVDTLVFCKNSGMFLWKILACVFRSLYHVTFLFNSVLTKVNTRKDWMTGIRPVLRIRIRIRIHRIQIHRIHVFLGLQDPDPDPLVRGMDLDPAPAPDPSIIMQK